jgi:hypothetical protein
MLHLTRAVSARVLASVLVLALCSLPHTLARNASSHSSSTFQTTRAGPKAKEGQDAITYLGTHIDYVARWAWLCYVTSLLVCHLLYPGLQTLARCRLWH